MLKDKKLQRIWSLKQPVCPDSMNKLESDSPKAWQKWKFTYRVPEN